MHNKSNWFIISCTFRTSYKDSHLTYLFSTFNQLRRFVSSHFASLVLSSCIDMSTTKLKLRFRSFSLSSLMKISLRPISTCQLHALLHFHLKPIYLVVFKGSYWLVSGISHLEGGFTLRCLQRLSLPDLATLPCCWYNNRYTSGPSIPVLSY